MSRRAPTKGDGADATASSGARHNNRHNNHGVPGKFASEIKRVERELTAAMTAHPRDPFACITALEKAIDLARARPDAAAAFDQAELLDLLAEEYERAGRVEDALAAMRQAIDAGWRGRPDGRCRLAEILMRSGRAEEARPIWAQVKADTPDDVWLYNNAGLEHAAIGEHETALAWLTDGLRLALDTGDPERLVAQLVDLRAESLAALGRDPDPLQARGQDHLTAG
jgi:tetratricopeptide (TPR) repeat protein